MSEPVELVGIGLRPPHFSAVLEGGLRVGLVEAVSENFMGRGGRPLAALERARRDNLIALHGVSLSVGGFDPFPSDYLAQLSELARRVEAAWVSDHLCFGGVGGHVGHDLWPMPFTEAALDHLVGRVDEAQHRLGRRLVLENVSSYVEFSESTLTEWELIGELLQRADCELLLDLNNLYINATNHGYDALAALNSLPSERIRQLHLAGHEDMGDYLFDTHGGPVADPVWALFEACVAAHGPIPTVVEWDQGVPPLDRLVDESRRAAALMARCDARAVG